MLADAPPGRPTACIALLHGINVGKARRIAMVDLRRVVEELGYTNVRTLLNSGNVAFETRRPNATRIAAAIDLALQHAFGFSASVVVVTADDLDAIIEENPLREIATDPAKHLVAFVAHTSVLAEAKPLLASTWDPDALALGTKAAYLWCANGVVKSKLMREFARLTGDAATTRNWATVLKLQASARGW